jgi:hypothetical protein
LLTLSKVNGLSFSKVGRFDRESFQIFEKLTVSKVVAFSSKLMLLQFNTSTYLKLKMPTYAISQS